MNPNEIEDEEALLIHQFTMKNDERAFETSIRLYLIKAKKNSVVQLWFAVGPDYKNRKMFYECSLSGINRKFQVHIDPISFKRVMIIALKSLSVSR